MGQKQEKEEIVSERFRYFYNAVNGKLKTSNIKPVIDLDLNSDKVKLSHRLILTPERHMVLFET